MKLSEKRAEAMATIVGFSVLAIAIGVLLLLGIGWGLITWGVLMLVVTVAIIVWNEV